MRRTLTTGASIWRRKGPAWPFDLLRRAVRCGLRGMPRGLIVEPSEGCHGACAGCPVLPDPVHLDAGLLQRWLSASPAEPVTLHFSGKHSDPLASPLLRELALTAARHGSMLSISTIGLGPLPDPATLPFDRWIFSLPAATEDSWFAIRGNRRLPEALETIEAVRRAGCAMVEVVLTLWRPSWRDADAFLALARQRGWTHTSIAFGRYHPDGQSIGRAGNLALEAPDCPYRLDSHGEVRLKRIPAGCPLAGCLFLDARGTLRPCPFTGDESPHLGDPSGESWRAAREWTGRKRSRAFPACAWCP